MSRQNTIMWTLASLLYRHMIKAVNELMQINLLMSPFVPQWESAVSSVCFHCHRHCSVHCHCGQRHKTISIPKTISILVLSVRLSATAVVPLQLFMAPVVNRHRATKNHVKIRIFQQGLWLACGLLPANQKPYLKIINNPGSRGPFY